MSSPSVSQVALRDLINGNCISDEIINPYMNLLSKTSNETIIVLDSQFFAALKYRGFASAVKWFKTINIDQVEFIVLPVHSKERYHWFLLGADLRSNCIIVFDSRYDNNSASETLNMFQSFLNEFLPSVRDWWGYAATVPQQPNIVDCGPYTMFFAEAVTRRAPITLSPDLNLREILRDQLMSEKISAISPAQEDPFRPISFLYPPRPTFDFFFDQQKPIEPPQKPIIDSDIIIDLYTPELIILASPMDTTSVASEQQIDAETAALMQRYLEKNESKKRPNRFKLKRLNGETSNLYPTEVRATLLAFKASC